MKTPEERKWSGRIERRRLKDQERRTWGRKQEGKNKVGLWRFDALRIVVSRGKKGAGWEPRVDGREHDWKAIDAAKRQEGERSQIQRRNSKIWATKEEEDVGADRTGQKRNKRGMS